MPVSKIRISSPLEAGSSLLSTQQLPSELLSALDYVSDYLLRKHLHITLIAVRSTGGPYQSPQISSASIYSGSTSSAASTQYSYAPTPSYASSTISRTQWPSLPSNPRDAPAFQSPSGPPAAAWTAAEAPNRYGITLVNSKLLSLKTEKTLRSIIAKAERKFPIGSGWLGEEVMSGPIIDSATKELMKRSITQNHVTYSGDGLTLLSLDYLYTFKCKLHVYSRSLGERDLGEAVDELRRLVLVQKGKKITKAGLMKAYPWLEITSSALRDVDGGYKWTYGGAETDGAIEWLGKEEKEKKKKELRIGTDIAWRGGNGKGGEEDYLEVPKVVVKEDRGPHYRGPLTPNQDWDITPGTRGEWNQLIRGEGRGDWAPVGEGFYSAYDV